MARSKPPLARNSPLLLAAAALLGTLSCDSGVRAASDPTRLPDVFVYLVDTLRPDHLGLYGYERETSPHLDLFAEDALVFERGYAPSSWTKASAASLFTGRTPSAHGARSRRHGISSSVPLLTERLADAGYRTVAVITNPNVGALWGFGRGFEEFIDLSETKERKEAHADEVIDRVLEILAAPDDRPLFLYVHTIDPHWPDIAREGFNDRWDDPSSWRDLYDGEIAFGDEHFGRLIEELHARGLYDSSFFAFLSDHGEEDLEHGHRGHGRTLFEEVIRIPLLLKLPENELGGRRFDFAASLVDVAPTLLALLGLPGAGDTDGLDLLPLVRGEREADPGRPLMLDLELELPLGGTLHVSRGVVAGRMKYLETSLPHPGGGLYDLADDPTEMRDLTEVRESEAELLRDLLVEHREHGLFLQLVGEPSAEPTKVRGVLRLDHGTFVNATRSGLESEDTVRILPRELKFALTLDPPGADGSPDVDTIVIQVDPPSARVRLDAAVLENGGAVPVYWGAEGERVDRLPLAIDPAAAGWALPRSSARRNSALEREFGLHLVVVEPTRSAEVELPEEVHEQLRHLGYAE